LLFIYPSMYSFVNVFTSLFISMQYVLILLKVFVL